LRALVPALLSLFLSRAQFLCGSSIAAPAKSCLSAFQICGIVNQTAWVQPAPPSPPYLAYCADSGWTLAVKSLSTSTQLAYSSNFWTNGSLLNSASTDLLPGNAVLQPFLDTPFQMLRVWMRIPSAGFGAPVDLSLGQTPNATLQSLFASSAINAVNSSAALQSWYDLVPGGATRQPNCNRQGLNVGAGGPTGFVNFTWFW
jgi:hypothetical protein